MRTIGVDFDGVIHKYGGGWLDGTIYDDPVDGAFDALRQMMTEYAVFVFTSRDPDQVRRWIVSKSGIPCTLANPTKFWSTSDVLLVTRVKFPAFRYIDDRAIVFANWGQALGELWAADQ